MCSPPFSGCAGPLPLLVPAPLRCSDPRSKHPGPQPPPSQPTPPLQVLGSDAFPGPGMAPAPLTTHHSLTCCPCSRSGLRPSRSKGHLALRSPPSPPATSSVKKGTHAGSSSLFTESTGHRTGGPPLPSLPLQTGSLQCSLPSCPFLKHRFHRGHRPQRLPLPVQLGLPREEGAQGPSQTQTLRYGGGPEAATLWVSPHCVPVHGVHSAGAGCFGVGKDLPVFLGKYKVGPMARKENGEPFPSFMVADLPHHGKP